MKFMVWPTAVVVGSAAMDESEAMMLVSIYHGLLQKECG